MDITWQRNLIGQKPPEAELTVMAELKEVKITWGKAQHPTPYGSFY